MEQIDWEYRWQEHLKKHPFSFSVLCDKCKITSSHCNCSKKSWIDSEKDKLGIPVDKPYTCDFCQSKEIYIWNRFLEGKVKDICRSCLDLDK